MEFTVNSSKRKKKEGVPFMRIGFVGTYTDKTSQGIYQFELDEKTGTLSNVSLFAKIQSSKYLALTEENLFSLYEEDGSCGVAVFDLKGNCLDKLSYEDGASCYLTVHNNQVFTSNYHLGTVSKLTFNPETQKLSHVKSHLIREKGGCHQVIPQGTLLFVPCLHLDKVELFLEDLTPQGEINFPTGSGPRHGVISKNGDYLYVLGELSNRIYAVNLKTREIEEDMSILPEGQEQNHGGAALRLSDDGTQLFASTREEQNRVTAVAVDGSKMSIIHTTTAGGKHPRDILNVLEDRYLLVANRGSNTLHSLDIHNKYEEINKVEVPEGVSIVLGGRKS